MGADRGAEAQTVTQQIRRDRVVRGSQTGTASDLAAQQAELLPQSKVNLGELLAERSHAIMRSQRLMTFRLLPPCLTQSATGTRHSSMQ
jgi:hypothetical protein